MQRRQDGKKGKKQKTSMSDKQRKYPRLYPSHVHYISLSQAFVRFFFARCYPSRSLNCANGDFFKHISLEQQEAIANVGFFFSLRCLLSSSKNIMCKTGVILRKKSGQKSCILIFSSLPCSRRRPSNNNKGQH